MAKRWGLGARILATSLGIFAVGLSIIIVAIVTLAGDQASKTSRALNNETAHRYGEQVTVDLGRSIDVARTLARSLEGLREQGVTDRKAYDALVKAALDVNSLLLDSWTVWEPNALDGRDRDFVNAPGSDATGRYLPVFTRAVSGNLEVFPNLDYDKPGAGDYYLVPKQTDKEFFNEPVLYSYTGKKEDELLMVAYCVPLHVNGKFVGVAGIDISLKAMTDRANAVRFFDTGYISVVSHQGVVLSHPLKEWDGQSIADLAGTPPGLIQAIGTAQDFSYIGKNPMTGGPALFDSVPIGKGLWDTPWALEAVAPLDQVLSLQTAISAITMGVGLVVFLVAALLLTLLVNRISRPIGLVARTLKTIADGEGDLTVRLDLRRNDEIGELSRNYDAFVDKLSEMIRMMQRTSSGLKTSGGDLAAALSQTAAALNEITANIQSAKENIDRQESLSTQTRAAAGEINRHVGSLQDLVARQDRAVDTSGSAVEEMVGNIESVTRNVEVLDSSLKRLIEASEDGRSRFDQFRDRVAAVHGQSENLQETNTMIAAIASQTNLLAMNAAIEAAHAGEAGRGFAVVADEIRKLAEQSALQSKGTAGELKSLQATIQNLVGDSEVTRGAFERILEEISRVQAIESEVQSAMIEQQQGSRQILEGIHDIREASHEVSEQAGAMKTEGEKAVEVMDTLHRVTQEIRSGMDELALGAHEINTALAAVSSQGTSNLEQASELADDAFRFQVRE